jgi:hypothetical protein
MPEINQNIEHWRGNSLLIEITILDENGQRIPGIDTSEAKWCVARNAQSKINGDLFVEKSTGTEGGLTLNSDSDTDYMLINLLPEDTEDLDSGTFYHEAEILDAAGNIYTVCIGKFTLRPAVLPPREDD